MTWCGLRDHTRVPDHVHTLPNSVHLLSLFLVQLSFPKFAAGAPMAASLRLCEIEGSQSLFDFFLGGRVQLIPNCTRSINCTGSN